MKRGAYSEGSTTCKLGYSQAMPAHLRGQILEITNLFTPDEDRGKGGANRLIAKICGQADLNSYILLVMPLPFDITGLTKLKLVNLYSKHGFTQIQDSPLLMARSPKDANVRHRYRSKETL